jgi:hypothetical protein
MSMILAIAKDDRVPDAIVVKHGKIVAVTKDDRGHCRIRCLSWRIIAATEKSNPVH